MVAGAAVGKVVPVAAAVAATVVAAGACLDQRHP